MSTSPSTPVRLVALGEIGLDLMLPECEPRPSLSRYLDDEMGRQPVVVPCVVTIEEAFRSRAR